MKRRSISFRARFTEFRSGPGFIVTLLAVFLILLLIDSALPGRYQLAVPVGVNVLGTLALVERVTRTKKNSGGEPFLTDPDHYWWHRYALLTVAGLGLFVLAGCVASPPPPSGKEMHALIGKTVLSARQQFPNLVSPLYDLSIAISQSSPSPDDRLALPEAWVIVDACPARKPSVGNIAVGVIPAALATPAIVAQAKNGDYRSLMFECGK